jgi:hypothetical protein
VLGRLFPLALLAACAGTTSSPAGDAVSPGVVVRAASLVAPYGCGTKTGQVYKYAAKISATDDANVPILRVTHAGQPLPTGVQVAGLFDCFADALLANLTSAAIDASDYTYTVTIYAYDKPTFDANQAAIGAAVAPPFDFSTLKANYTYTTTCTATLPTSGLTSGSFPLIQVLAQCQPLAAAPVDAGAPDASSD